jgi:sialate O-acetylesterase
VYRRKIEYLGPVYAGMKVQGQSIVIRFAHADGLRSKDGPLQWFQIAGPDGRYVDATASIEGKTVIVHSDQITEPVSVRYAWDSYPQGANLVNGAGLPAPPFRTDAQDVLTPVASGFTGK